MPGRIVDALKTVGGEALLSAEQGDVEQMVDPVTGEANPRIR